jgi:uncharacterized protein YlxP (DUF503 family)
MVVRSLKDRIQYRFKVSVAETDHQYKWTGAHIAVAVVAKDAGYVEEVLEKADRLVQQESRALIL